MKSILASFALVFCVALQVHAAAPIVHALNVSEGPVEGHTKVIVLGENFTKDDAVFFGSQRVVLKRVISSTKLIIHTVNHAAGVVDVSVQNQQGSGVLSNAYEFKQQAPQLNSISTAEGIIDGGTPVFIYGTYFTDTMKIKYNGNEVEMLRFYDSSRILIQTPEGVAGVVDVEVENQNGNSLLASAFTYHNNPPIITSLSRSSGLVDGGAIVRVHGKNFRLSDQWFLGGQQVELISTSNFKTNSISFKTPASSTGMVNLDVVSVVGNASLASAFEYEMADPVVTTIAPNKGLSEGGTTTYIYGENFSANSIASFAQTPASVVHLLHDRKLKVITPAGAPGAVDVTVDNTYGQVINYGGFTYSDTLPRLHWLSPNNGVVDGQTPVTVYGRNFKTGMSVKFDGIDQASVSLRNSNILKFKTIAVSTPQSVNLSLETSEGFTERESAFAYTEAAPEITSVYPTILKAGVKKPLYIKGRNFTSSSIVKVGQTVLPIERFYASSFIMVRAPANPAGSYDVSVESAYGTKLLVNGIQYSAPGDANDPKVKNLYPASGPVGAPTVVTIHGSNFDASTIVEWNGQVLKNVKVAAGRIIRFTCPIATAPSVASLKITNASGSLNIASAFRYVAEPPAIKSLKPAQGFVYGDTLIAVYGKNFTKNMSLSIGGSKAKLYRYFNSEKAYFVTTPGQLGAQNVVINTDHGSLELEGGFVYQAKAPYIKRVLPNHGPVSGGKLIRIYGSYFSKGTELYINGVQSSFVRVVGTKFILAKTPSAGFAYTKTVDIKLKTPFGETTDLNAYTYDGVVDREEPNISFISPAEKSYVGASFLVTGNANDAISGIDDSSFELRVDGVDVTGEQMVSGEFSYALSNLTEGLHLLNASVKDNAGNSNSTGRAITVDLTSPTLSITNPDQDGLIFTTTSPTFAADFADTLSGVASIQLSVNGNVQIGGAINNGTYEIVIPDLTSGNHMLSVVAVDNVGNLATKTRNFAVDLSESEAPNNPGTSDNYQLLTIAEGANPQHLQVRDVNKDGKPDIVYKDINENRIKVIYQK